MMGEWCMLEGRLESRYTDPGKNLRTDLLNSTLLAIRPRACERPVENLMSHVNDG
jgi:hypothetical protein